MAAGDREPADEESAGATAAEGGAERGVLELPDAAPGDPLARNATGESVLALVMNDGTVTGWTRAAEDLIGLAARDVVGRRADFFLGSDDGLTVSAIADRLGGSGGWSDTVLTSRGQRRRLELSRLSGAGGEAGWLLTAPAGPVPGTSRRPVPADRRTVGRAVWDLELRCVLLNDVLEQTDGIARGQRLGHRVAQVTPGFDADALEAVMNHVLRTGTPALDFVHRRPTTTVRSRAHTVIVSLFRLDGADGTPIAVCSVGVDVTREEQARERLAVLGEASIRIGTTDDIMRTSQELADFTVPRIADYVTVDLAESVRLGDEPLALLSPDSGRIPVFHRAGIASVHPDMREALFNRGSPVYAPPSSPFTDVLITGNTVFQPVLDPARDAWARDPHRARRMIATGMHTVILVPVREGDAILGVAMFVRNENPLPFSEEDLRLVEDLVAQTARRLNLQRTKATDRAMALALQRNLLPHRLKAGPGLEVHPHFVPADVEEGVGGDWFDVISLRESCTGLVVGDVVGHGIGAAAAMGRLRTAVRTLAYMDLPPDELLARMDHVLMSFAEGDATDDAKTSAIVGATCLFLIYDPVRHVAVAASAGHPPPVVVGPDGTVAFPEVAAGTPLGYGLSRYRQVEFDVPEGSLIALYTDGLVETRGSDIDVGMNRLATALTQPGLSLRELSRAAFDARPTDQLVSQAQLQLRDPADDATLLLARTGTAAPVPGSTSWGIRL